MLICCAAISCSNSAKVLGFDGIGGWLAADDAIPELLLKNIPVILFKKVIYESSAEFSIPRLGNKYNAAHLEDSYHFTLNI
jgi:hypothetical protein